MASAGEGDVFHNRLTHSLKVAQIARRLAERLLHDYPGEERLSGRLDPDVVEAAALAHDLGHPPFGHDGEDAICKLVEQGDEDGFEGNAQSFRIVARLSAHADNRVDQEDSQVPAGNAGLNLTRASLNAILKYPRFRAKAGEGHRKWGAYVVDKDRFRWARTGSTGNQRSLEAELMNWADDVTYAVHDLEDFYRAGLIPIHRLRYAPEQSRFIAAAINRNSYLEQNANRLEATLNAVLGPLAFLDTRYDGGRVQRMFMNAAASSLITQFISYNAIQLSESSEQSVAIDQKIRLQVELLQELTYHYVIGHPRMVSIREGQREVLGGLFRIYLEVVDDKRNRALLPQSTLDRLDSGDYPHRLVADLLAGMTERQVIQTYRRLTGIIPSPVAYFDV